MKTNRTETRWDGMWMSVRHSLGPRSRMYQRDETNGQEGFIIWILFQVILGWLAQR